MLRRVSVDGSVDDNGLEAWMAEADSDGNGSLSFFEYVRVDTQVATRLTAQNARLPAIGTTTTTP